MDVLRSKKFWAFLVAIVGVGSAWFGGAITPAEGVEGLVIAAGAYMLGQGWADQGKEAEKLKAKSK